MWEMKAGAAPQKVLSTANGTGAGHEAEHHASYMMIFILPHINLKETVSKLFTLTFKAG
jgi:hypothetical protein